MAQRRPQVELQGRFKVEERGPRGIRGSPQCSRSGWLSHKAGPVGPGVEVPPDVEDGLLRALGACRTGTRSGGGGLGWVEACLGRRPAPG